MALDIRLREIATKAAGTYFMVTDNSASEEILPTSNLRLFFINVNKGPVNTVVVFKKGDVANFTAIFGKGNRQQQKRGNFGNKSCIEALSGGPIAVMNLRSFDEILDKTTIVGINPNILPIESKLTNYTNLFNNDGLWTAKGKNIVDQLNTPHLLNIGNIGTNDVSFFVTASKYYSEVTNEGNESIRNSILEVDDYPALDVDMLIKNTFVDVYVFNNKFEALTVGTNKYYGQLFDADGNIKLSDIETLANIKESGFARRITGSLIPGLKSEFDNSASIDTLMNAVFPETGLIAYLNDDILESEDLVINTNLLDYYLSNGTLKNAATSLKMLSHIITPKPIVKAINLGTVIDADVELKNTEFILKVEGGIFGALPQYGNKVLSVFENGIRIGDEIIFTDKDTQVQKRVEVVSMNIVQENLPTASVILPALPKSVISIPAIANDNAKPVINWTASTNATSYLIERKELGGTTWTTLVTLASPTLTYTDTTAVKDKTYVYLVTAKAVGYIESYAIPFKIVMPTTAGGTTLVAGVASTVDIKTDLSTTVLGVKTYSIAELTLSYNLNALSYTRKKDLVESVGTLVFPTNLISYKPREAQFTDGSAIKQKEILDMMVSPGIVKGLKNFDGLRYLVDAFKSFVEPSYKYQFGQLCLELDKGNKFVRAIINEPFIEDLQKSTNPLFRQAVNGVFDLSYLPEGGNKQYSTRFLTKFNAGAEMCFFFGSGKVEGNDLMVQAPGVSSAFIAKAFPFDVVANASGYLDNIGGIEINPDDIERAYFEKFKWNPIIKKTKGFVIYGNYTGQKKKTALSQIHNSELLCYIKETLTNMSIDEAFKKGLYNEYLATEIEIGSFFESLVLSGAIQPNPVVICNASNNTPEVSKQLIKLIHIEYFNVNSLDKVVFDLNLN